MLLSLSLHCIWRPSSPCDALEATCFSSCPSFFPRHPEHHSGISRYLFAPVAHGSSCAGRVARKNKRRGRRRSEMFINKADLFAIPTHTYTHTHKQLHILIRKFISIDNEKIHKKTRMLLIALPFSLPLRLLFSLPFVCLLLSGRGTASPAAWEGVQIEELLLQQCVSCAAASVADCVWDVLAVASVRPGMTK